jgi:WD40 repeat protein
MFRMKSTFWRIGALGLTVFLLSLLIISFSVHAQSYTEIIDIDWNADGTRIAAAYLDGQVKVINASTQQVTLTLQHASNAWISWDPVNPDLLAVANWDDYMSTSDPVHNAQIIDVSTGAVLHQFATEVFTHSIAFSPDGTRILISNSTQGGGPSQRGFIDAIDVATGGETVEFEDVPSQVTSAIWNPNGDEIAGLNLGVIQLWNATTGQIVQTISELETAYDSEAGGEITTGLFGAIDWSPDGTRIASADETSVIVWDRATLQKVLVVPFILGVDDLAWSPNGQWIAVARGSDQLVQIIDANTGALVNEIPTNTETDVAAWNPSSTQIAYGTAADLPVIVNDPGATAS